VTPGAPPLVPLGCLRLGRKGSVRSAGALSKCNWDQPAWAYARSPNPFLLAERGEMTQSLDSRQRKRFIRIGFPLRSLLVGPCLNRQMCVV